MGAEKQLEHKFNFFGEWCNYDVFIDEDKKKYYFVFNKKYNIRKVIAKDELESKFQINLKPCNKESSREYLSNYIENIDDFDFYCFIDEGREGL